MVSAMRSWFLAADRNSDGYIDIHDYWRWSLGRLISAHSRGDHGRRAGDVHVEAFAQKSKRRVASVASGDWTLVESCT